MDLDNYVDNNLDDIINDSLETQPELTEQELLEEENDLEDLQLENAELAYDLAFKNMVKDIEGIAPNKHEEYYNNLFNEQMENVDDVLFDNDHYMNLMNVFVTYYNEKFDKVENFFTGIDEICDDDKNNDNNNNISGNINGFKPNECSNIIELFLEAIFELRIIMEHFNIDDIKLAMKMIYNETENSNIISDILNSDNDHKLYCLEIKEKNKETVKIYSLSLIICLNYVVDNVLPKQETMNTEINEPIIKKDDINWFIFDLKSH